MIATRAPRPEPDAPCVGPDAPSPAGPPRSAPAPRPRPSNGATTTRPNGNPVAPAARASLRNSRRVTAARPRFARSESNLFHAIDTARPRKLNAFVAEEGPSPAKEAKLNAFV